jgi:hypothetical protein
MYKPPNGNGTPEQGAEPYESTEYLSQLSAPDGTTSIQKVGGE